MGKNFSLKEHLSDVTLRASSRQFLSKMDNISFEKIDVRKLRPAADGKNFYHIDQEDVDAIAASIELLGEIQENLVVKPVAGTDEYEVIAGNTRRMAALQLVNEGKGQYAMVPCRIMKEDVDSVDEELVLILTNSTQRVRNDAEKMHEVERLRLLIGEYRKQHEGVFSGNIQKIIADILHISKSKVGRLDNISRNLSDGLKREFEQGNINVSVANELAGLPMEKQEELQEQMEETGDAISMKDVYMEKLRQAQVAERAEEHTEADGVGDSDVFTVEMHIEDVSDAGEECQNISRSLAGDEKLYAEEKKHILKLTTWYVRENGETLLHLMKGIIEDELERRDVETDVVGPLAERLYQRMSDIASYYRQYILDQMGDVE